MAYSVKTFLSNMGMSLYIGDKLKLPLGDEDEDDHESVLHEMLRQVVWVDGIDSDGDIGGDINQKKARKEKKRAKKNRKDDNESEIGGDSDDEPTGIGGHKKKRKKRGKGGK